MKFFYYSFIILFLISPIILIGCNDTSCKSSYSIMYEYHYIVSGAGTVEVNGEYIQIADRNDKAAFALATCPDLNACDYTIEYDDTLWWCIKNNATITILYSNQDNQDYPPYETSALWTIEGGAPDPPTSELIVNQYLIPTSCG